MANSMTAAAARRALRAHANPDKATFHQRFFKTGPGEYGEGDVFIGVTVPNIRKAGRTFRELPQREITKLLSSKIHEERLLALIILCTQYERGDDKQRRAIFQTYLRHMDHVNNWDLVDTSAPTIVGGHLKDRSRKRLYTWAKSKNLWRRRIAILATYHFIREEDFGDTLAISEQLLGDEEDLIHKAVGWMLREVGNRDRATEERFLRKHYRVMPRTMLRYAIEKLPEKRRRAYLEGTVRGN